MKNTNALTKEQMKNENQHGVSNEIRTVEHRKIKAVPERKAGLTDFVVLASLKAGHGGYGVWRLLFGYHPVLMKKGPNDRGVEIFNEYRTLQDQTLSPFLRR